MTKRIDLAAVQAARARLKEIAEEHPELRGPSDIETWTNLLEKAMGPTKQISVRLPEELLARVDRYTQQLRREHPGIAYTRGDAFKALLTHALEALEAKRK